MRAQDLLEDIHLSCPDATTRRQSLTTEMKELEKKEQDCMQCPGHCCTYQNNSMLVDPFQALELWVYLERNGLLEKYLPILKKNIQEFRLDKEVFIGKGREFRRYYTCPFFKQTNCGCPIDPNYKPYGCLAFNPLEKGVTESGHCESNLDLLQQRDDKFGDIEQRVNQRIKDELGLYWDKKSIPVALIELSKKLSE
jgi:hypothetical protein